MDKPFTIDDFRLRFVQIKKAGLKNMMGSMPGMSEVVAEGEDPDVAMQRVMRIIDALTPEQRADPKLIDASAREAVAARAGVQPQQVIEFLTQFEKVQELMQRMMSMSLWQRLKMVLGFRVFPRLPPNDT